MLVINNLYKMKITISITIRKIRTFWAALLLILCFVTTATYAVGDKEKKLVKKAMASKKAIEGVKKNLDKKNDDTSPISVTISGASEELENNLKAFLPSLRILKCDSSQNRVDRFIEASADKLVAAGEALGYFNAKYNMTATKKSGCWSLNINAKPGETVKVYKQDIQLDGVGKQNKAFQSIMENPPYLLGDVLVSQHYLDYKTRLKRTANSLGFFDAELSRHIIKVNPFTNKATIELTFNTGERYRIGKIDVQQEILTGKYLQRYIRLKEGADFSSDEIIHQQRVLEKSGYYKTVQVTANYKEAANHLIPVTIKATKRKRYTYKGTLGFASDDGLFFQLGMDVHWVNSRGHQLSTTSRYSAKDPAIGLNYKIPLWNPEFEYLNLSAGWNRSDNDDIRGTAIELGADYHRRSDSHWDQVLSLSYLDEKTEIDGEPTLHSQLTMFGIGTNKTRKNDSLFPTEGWRFNGGLKGAVEGLLSDQTLLQARADGKYLHTFRNDGKILLRGDIGATLFGDFDEMPKSLRFFAGGQSSVRGFSFESIGERNKSGKVIGGKNLLVMSAEYEHPVMDKISAAVFVDAGSAFDDWGDYALDVGFGIGARYKSPLGPIRVDFAAPEDDPSDIKFYFSLGPDL